MEQLDQSLENSAALSNSWIQVYCEMFSSCLLTLELVVKPLEKICENAAHERVL